MTHVSDAVRIFVGCAANNEDLESQAVLEYTLRKHSSMPIEIEWMQLSKDPSSFWYSDPTARKGWVTDGWATPFSAFRYAVPERCGFQGRAIYMDSDMIVRADIAELFCAEMRDGAAIIAKGDGQRYCVTLFDCERVQPRMLSADRLRASPRAYQDQRAVLTAARGLVQPFGDLGDWNCCDGEGYKTILDPAIKCLHYTAISTQPQLRHALRRLKDAGGEHWFKGQAKRHPRIEVEELFDAELKAAIGAGYPPDAYTREPFGWYGRGCTGGAFASAGYSASTPRRRENYRGLR